MAKKLTFEYVQDFIEKEGYKLISEEYVNSRSYLDVMCPEGHLYKVKFNVFQSGSRCPKCSRKMLEESMITNMLKITLKMRGTNYFQRAMTRVIST